MADLEEKSSSSIAPMSAKHDGDYPENSVHTATDKKAARRIVSAINWVGVNTLMNSSLSLWITFKALPTSAAQSAMSSMGKWIFKPTVLVTDKVKSLFGRSKLNGLSEAQKEFRINENARSTAEVVCMVIAGSLLLPIIKFVENHKNQWVDKIDGWLHPSHKQDDSSAVVQQHEQPITWGKLLKARAIGLAGVFGTNHLMQTFNNSHPESLFNSDTTFTRIGNKLFDKLPEKIRHRFVWVFSGFSNNSISVESIQPAMQLRAFQNAPDELKQVVSELGQLRDGVLKNPDLHKHGYHTRKLMLEKGFEKIEPRRQELLSKIRSHPEFGPAVEKAIFAEQTRLFGKELTLTLLITGIMYAVTKTSGSMITKALETTGIKKNADSDNTEKSTLSLKCQMLPQHEENTKSNWSEKEEIKSKKHVTQQPSVSFTESISHKSSEPVASIA